jgi:hypothetical protein
MFSKFEILLLGFDMLNFPKKLSIAMSEKYQIVERLTRLKLSSPNAGIRLGIYVKA